MQSSVTCDNFRDCHDPIIINEDERAIQWFCKLCNSEGTVYKDERGVPNRFQYYDVFKRLALQGNDNLFYKYYPKHLKI